MTTKNAAQNVLQFWFGSLQGPNDIPYEKSSMWFANGKDYDDFIREQFGDLFQQACEGELNHWEQAPKSLLALILLLDQFSRHIYRETKQSFSQDLKCQQLVKLGIEKNFDHSLFFIERKFFYMPLMHAEDIDTQNLSLKMFENLRDDVPEELKEFYSKTLSFAESHRYVIEQFGRFPELNKILGRDSTKEEEAFLATGKYQFL